MLSVNCKLLFFSAIFVNNFQNRDILLCWNTYCCLFLKCLLLFFIAPLVAPAIMVRQDAVFAAIGQKVVLECISDSHPNSFNYWLDPSGKKIIQGAQYRQFCSYPCAKYIHEYFVEFVHLIYEDICIYVYSLSKEAFMNRWRLKMYTESSWNWSLGRKIRAILVPISALQTILWVKLNTLFLCIVSSFTTSYALHNTYICSQT